MNTIEKNIADLIRKHPHLYDQSRQDYRDNAKAQSSWREIAENVGKTVVEVKIKWKNLRDKFCKAKKRLAQRSFPQRTDQENLVERPAPVLFSQLAWLSPYVKPIPGNEEAGSGEDLEKEQDEDEKHGSMPVISTSFSFVEPSPNINHQIGIALKCKSQTFTETETSSADALTNPRDEDELFLLSLLPSLKRLTIKKRMEVRMKFQQVLYAAEFED